MLQSFLMIGQSNMAGRGFQHEVPLLFDEQIKMLRNGRWQVMMEPVNYDRSNAGVGLAASFAAALRLDDPALGIGLIPCADGGTNLDDWAEGGALFEHAVAQARLAQRSSKIAGILWHQGESDCFPDRALQYREKLKQIVTALRSALQLPDVPLVLGGLGDFLTKGMYGAYFGSYLLINQALLDFAGAEPHCYFVSAEGLEANPDGIHINAASQRLFGIRYSQAYKQRSNVLQATSQEQAILQQIYDRPLSPTEQRALLELRFSAGLMTLDAYKTAMQQLMDSQ